MFRILISFHLPYAHAHAHIQTHIHTHSQQIVSKINFIVVLMKFTGWWCMFRFNSLPKGNKKRKLIVWETVFFFFWSYSTQICRCDEWKEKSVCGQHNYFAWKRKLPKPFSVTILVIVSTKYMHACISGRPDEEKKMLKEHNNTY